MEVQKLISKFIANVFEKKYSDADVTLQNIVESKVKEKIEKASKKIKGDKNPIENKDSKKDSNKNNFFKKDSDKDSNKNKFFKKVTKKGNKQG